jgi:hypothetical protein
MKFLSRFLPALLLFLAGLAIHAQSATPTNPPASVSFGLDWNQGLPWTSYTITLAESGATHFSGQANPAGNTGDDRFQQDFTMTEANRQKVFELAKAANYFDGQFEARQKNIARTGMKTLGYRGPASDHSTTFNYSPNPNIQQITKIFQSIATTLDFGRKLAFLYRFDKLGMDACLQQLTDLQARGMVEELQAIEPILRKIADDPNLMHIARTQAKQLLKSAGLGSAATGPQSSQM